MDPLAALSDPERALLRPAPVPARVEVMAAVRTDRRFSDPAWVFERKLDGIRCIAIRDGDGVRLLSRNHLPLERRFPGLAGHVGDAGPEGDFVLDGEVVAFAGGRTSFGALQGGGRGVVLYLFDVLHVAGHDVTALPLRARKGVLRRAVRFGGPVRFTPHRNRDGEELYARACRAGWEGLIAKRADAPYTHGRSPDWLKFKCDARQELVVGGFTAPRGGRTDLGALLVGHYDDGALRYAGRVGTGFTRATLGDLAARLGPLRRDDPPFADAPRLRDATWVEPRLVAEVGFTEWTRDGRLRHPRFLGLRDDKDPREVVRE
ncbi:non-homologous end-joining DNA ligase [Miltoncostaea oceani]|jgi:bifunctional non-homologous end joining protein LigD|uniref:non-homologous end-joining DNA ligase n=1 Tax=Miltoncostaea oceani TaxID=2843216 RepID=UPI001C3D888E|nr:non-homologous end-joining DNA ligase [Miltoncostaea oceani]